MYLIPGKLQGLGKVMYFKENNKIMNNNGLLICYHHFNSLSNVSGNINPLVTRSDFNPIPSRYTLIVLRVVLFSTLFVKSLYLTYQ